MRTCIRLGCLICAVLVPTSGNAQVYHFTTPPPAVTAASADWQIGGEPIFYAGGFYYPAGPDVFFDGNVMVRTGVYRSIPLYEDRTLQPYSVVFVPVGRGIMRPYERRAGRSEGEFTDAMPAPAATAGYLPEERGPSRPEPSTTGASAPLESIPAPTGNRGIFVEYAGTRWYSAGPAVTIETDRLQQIGTYFGFPVYGDPDGAADRILIPAVPGGALTPYRR
jgi:hypothetical protein